jgi:hypothetical protein
MKKFLFVLSMCAATIARAEPPTVLVYGELLSVTDTGLLVSCDAATHSHPTGYYNVGPSKNRIVHVSGDPKSIYVTGRRGALDLNSTAKEGRLAFLARDPGEKYTYTTKAGPKNTVPNLDRADSLPLFSAIKATGSAPGVAQPATTPATSRSLFGTVMDTPRYNLETEIKDLRIGLPAEKVVRILGNPQQINGSQWVYGGGYIYIENGVVTAMQNKSGGVFDASWKR